MAYIIFEVKSELLGKINQIIKDPKETDLTVRMIILIGLK